MPLLRTWNPFFTQWSSDDEAIRVIACYNERTKIEPVAEFFGSNFRVGLAGQA